MIRAFHGKELIKGDLVIHLLQSVAYLFILLAFLKDPKILILMKFNLAIFSLKNRTYNTVSKNSLQTQGQL